MPHKLKSAPARYEGLRPRSMADRRSVVRIVVYGLLAVGLVFGFRLLQSHWQEQREHHWSAASAIVLDVRPVLVTQSGSAYGRMLYNTQVLVSFESPQGALQRWVTLRKLPATMETVQQQTIRWKGTRCIVRWNPADHNQIDAEIS